MKTIQITISLTLADAELQALYDDCLMNLAERHEVNGINLRPIYQQIREQIEVYENSRQH